MRSNVACASGVRTMGAGLGGWADMVVSLGGEVVGG